MATPSATLQQLVAETGWLRRLARALVKDAAAADDLVQDTYVVAATQAPTDGRPLRPWLTRVLWNRVRMRSRGAGRRRAREEAFAELATAPPRPDEIVGRIEIQRMLAGLVLELASPVRDVLLLHYFEGLTSSEIGARLGISPGTVRWRLKQAIDELRDRLEQRSPNHAWVAPLAGFAGRSAPLPLAPMLLVVAFIAIAIFAVVLQLQLRHRDDVRSSHEVMHVTARPELRALDSSNATTTRDAGSPWFGDGFAAEQRRLEGTVIDETGRSVEGADVELECGYDDGAASPKQRTNASGAFAFDVDPQCRYRLTATKGAARGIEVWIHPRRGGPLTIRIGPTTRAVIRVLDADTGAPIAGAEVTVWRAFSSSSAVATGADGIAHLDTALPAQFTVEAAHHVVARGVLEHPNHPELSELDDAATDVPAEVHREVRMKVGIVVGGTVLGPDSRAVSGAEVSLVGPRGAHDYVYPKATTDETGRFEATVPTPGGYGLTAERRDLMTTNRIVVEVPVEGTANVVAHVEHRGEIHGTVVDLHFRPAGGARVGLADGSVRPVVADRNGNFTIENVDGALDLIARRGAETSPFQHLQVGAGERVDVVLQVGPTGISGIAVDHQGSPVEGAHVWLNACCDAGSVVGGKGITTDASGAFSFDVPRGDFVLSVKRDTEDDYDDDDDIRVSGGSHDVRVVVP